MPSPYMEIVTVIMMGILVFGSLFGIVGMAFSVACVAKKLFYRDDKK